MNSLPYLDLELKPTRFARQGKGLTLLTCGAVLLLSVLTHYALLSHKLDVIERDRLDSTANQSFQSKRANPASNAEIKAINSSIEQLSLPWTVLFEALEATKAEDVHLLSIEPDAQNASVKIMAEAADVYGMLDYQRGLSTQKGLSDVALVQYEVQAANNAEPVRFTLSVNWGVVR